MTKTLKIPKKIAGVKVPRQVRKKAKKAIKAGASPVVREIAAAAIGAAAQADGARQAGEAIARRFEGRARVGIDGDKVAEAFRAAALNGLRSFLEGLEEGLKAADRQPRPPTAPKAPKPPKKPKAAKKPKAPKSPRPAASPGGAPAP